MKTLILVLALSLSALAQVPDAPSTFKDFAKIGAAPVLFHLGANLADDYTTRVGITQNNCVESHSAIYTTLPSRGRLLGETALETAAATGLAWVIFRGMPPSWGKKRVLAFFPNVIFGSFHLAGGAYHNYRVGCYKLGQ